MRGYRLGLNLVLVIKEDEDEISEKLIKIIFFLMKKNISKIRLIIFFIVMGFIQKMIFLKRSFIGNQILGESLVIGISFFLVLILKAYQIKNNLKLNKNLFPKKNNI